MNVNVYNRFASLLALLALATAVLLLIPGVRRFAKETGADAVFPWVALTVAVLSTAGSLTYAIAYDFTPCELCWYQRITMYPLVVILGVGAYLKESVRRFALPLTITGMGLAIYHYLLQTFPNMTSSVCSVDVPCNSKYVNEFGFISIPFMALCGFIAITALLLSHRYEETV
ncbi:MAG: disulfide bond formation protein B [Acidimicrobiia bacterium]|nr:disulfide bond formation protein B [Acidimicrobiia bacterium]